jgi:hypothetical protein
VQSLVATHVVVPNRANLKLDEIRWLIGRTP